MPSSFILVLSSVSSVRMILVFLSRRQLRPPRAPRAPRPPSFLRIYLIVYPFAGNTVNVIVGRWYGQVVVEFLVDVINSKCFFRPCNVSCHTILHSPASRSLHSWIDFDKTADAVIYMRIVSRKYVMGKLTDALKAFVCFGNHYYDIGFKIFVDIFRYIADITGDAEYAVLGVYQYLSLIHI